MRLVATGAVDVIQLLGGLGVGWGGGKGMAWSGCCPRAWPYDQPQGGRRRHRGGGGVTTAECLA